MALIQCPECGKEVSDKARACPHCGNPAIPAAIQKPEKHPSKARRAVLIVLAVCLAAGLLFTGLHFPQLVTLIKLQPDWYTVVPGREDYRLDFGWDGTLRCIDDSASGDKIVASYSYKILSSKKLQIDDTTYDIGISKMGIYFEPLFMNDSVWFREKNPDIEF